jgi:hypothetical protein
VIVGVSGRGSGSPGSAVELDVCVEMPAIVSDGTMALLCAGVALLCAGVALEVMVETSLLFDDALSADASEVVEIGGGVELERDAEAVFEATALLSCRGKRPG